MICQYSEVIFPMLFVLAMNLLCVQGICLSFVHIMQYYELNATAVLINSDNRAWYFLHNFDFVQLFISYIISVFNCGNV